MNTPPLFATLDTVSDNPRIQGPKGTKTLCALITSTKGGDFNVEVFNGDGKNCKRLTAELFKRVGDPTKVVAKDDAPKEAKAQITTGFSSGF